MTPSIPAVVAVVAGEIAAAVAAAAVAVGAAAAIVAAVLSLVLAAALTVSSLLRFEQVALQVACCSLRCNAQCLTLAQALEVWRSKVSAQACEDCLIVMARPSRSLRPLLLLLLLLLLLRLLCKLR